MDINGQMDHKLILAENQHLFLAAGGRKFTNSLPVAIIRAKNKGILLSFLNAVR